MTSPDRQTLRRHARVAGLWYLAMAITGPVGLVVVPTRVIVAGDAEATAHNVVTYETLIRVGVVTNLLCQICFIFLALALRRLFWQVDEYYTRLLQYLVIAGVSVAMVVEFLPLTVLQLASGEGYLTTFTTGQLNTLTLLLFTGYSKGITIASVFWGLWLLPFGILVIRSGFIPKILGYLLILGGASYVVSSSATFLAPEYADGLSAVLMVPLSVGEIATVLWLVIKGVRD